ncbi:hypothetical protein LJC11_01115 [Bacteroidales bacterium OttesenSCG-928-I21]|nr:hypothetical protein [Bacteroidales bacterium OttesenSCG-928-I21]
MKKLLFISIFLLFIGKVYSQSLINLKETTVKINGDTIFLDTLSVVESSIQLYDTNMQAIKVAYSFDFEKSMIIFESKPEISEIKIRYKTFPINFFSETALYKRDKFLISEKGVETRYDQIFSGASPQMSYFDNNLSRKGSISRGISFGNNQDVIVNSNLNLQLDGRLSKDLYITAAISDNNIPIQPDGTSQQLQEFDKVFIKIYNDKISLTAGDFELRKPKGYFMNYLKKAQGIDFGISGKIKKKKGNPIAIKSSISGAVAKGKLRRQQIQGEEGNQGPYKLTGENQEMYIVVLAGTERVYIDGILMSRGHDRDYIIDYNLGEIIFTASQPINKDKRIIVEFEYSDRNYTRFLVTSSNTIDFDKTKLWLNIYNENDNKNQPFDQDLSIESRKLLSEIGDNLDMAIIPGFDSIDYEPSEIRYKLTDSIVEGIWYDSIFVYSTNPNEAYYRVYFSFVGENKGNYVKGITAANGKVYQWVTPINGVPQGNYIPYRKVITPKKNQLITLGGETEIANKTKIFYELGYSNNDLNTFSKLDANDNHGYALKLGIEQGIIKNENSYLSANLNYDFLQKNFKPIENFRPTEFTRDWNLENLHGINNENILNGGLLYTNKKLGNASYNLAYLNRASNEYEGLQNSVKTDLKHRSWHLIANGSFLNSSDHLHKTKFLRHNIQISKEIWHLKFGLKESSEQNIWSKNNTDSIVANSFSFNQYEAFVSTNDTLKYKFSASYIYRDNKSPSAGALNKSTSTQDISFSSEIIPNLNHRFKTIMTYRKLDVKDSILYSGESENNLIGKVEYNLRLLKGMITSSTFYEISSGLERKTEFSYVEVAAGQGVYTWIDYNENGVQEINEFEIAHYVDQANFIRVISPTAEYIKTYSSQISQNININPEIRWRNKQGILKFLSRFSNQFSYSAAQKNISSNLLEYANPFYNELDETKLVSFNSSLRNNFSFNRNNPKFGIDYVIHANNNKTLLVSGFDTRTNFAHNILIKYNINSKFGLQNKTGIGDKSYFSEYFSEKNYEIKNQQNELQANFQPTLNNRLSIKYNYKLKDNINGEEKLIINDLGVDYRLSSVKKGTLNIAFNYIHYNYDGETNSAIAYEILEGLLPGSNLTWSVNFQRILANGLQLNLSYNARKSADTKVIHTGGMQIRAFF